MSIALNRRKHNCNIGYLLWFEALTLDLESDTNSSPYRKFTFGTREIFSASKKSDRRTSRIGGD
jgi:hypothetical protein